MNKNEAKEIISSTFSSDFDEQRYKKFVSNLFKTYNPEDKIVEGQYIKLAYKTFVIKYKITGTFEDREGHKIDILEVNLNKASTLERARTAQRNFVAEYLKSRNKDAALVAFVSPDNKEWRLSLVKLENSLEVIDEKLKTKEEITPAKRWSFLVGENEGSHTAQSRFVNILVSDEDPNLAELESAFDIETVTKEFFHKYTELYFQLKDHLDSLMAKDEIIKKDFEGKEISTVDFAKKTLGQIVFLYFLQKKGWFGVAPDKQWGEGPKRFLRDLFTRKERYGANFFNDILEPLFYEALAQDRGTESIYPRLNNCRMPFLNGGLFEPMNGYLWETTDIIIPDELFSNNHTTKEGDKGDGILDVFDRYNFTVNENEPLEKEVAVDPEMLGKVFENLLDIKDRKSKGAFYTPREIVHYMCQESLINYLNAETNNEIPRGDLELFIQKGDRIIENDKIALERQEERIKKYGNDKYKDSTYSLLLPISVRTKAEKLDELLKNIKVADPAVGSGAFPLGMINEIVRARKVLNVYLKSDISDYELKKHTITHSIYGVDIDPGAVDIAKLRLWLALVVDEETPHPLPNLEHKIMQGNSLISEYEGIKLFDESIFDEEKSHKTEQLALGLGKTSSELKMETLQDKIASFVNESQRTKKQNLKKEIDDLKWELIEETLKEQGKEDKLEDIKKLRRKNIRPFFIWKLEFSDVFKEKGGFDVVIGNPPYVGVKGNSKIFDDIKKGHFGIFYSGRGELFYFFFHLALEIGKDKSLIAYITTNYFPTATYGSVLRKDIKEKSQIIRLINFNELRIFESAQGQHNMITILQKSNDRDIVSSNSITHRKEVANSSILSNILLGKDKKSEYFSIPQHDLYEGQNDYIRLNGTSTKNSVLNGILNNISKYSPLIDICYVRQGLRTGIDRISNSHLTKYDFNGKKDEGVFVLSKNELNNLSLSENEMCAVKEFYKNSDIARYFSKKHSNKFIFYLDNQYDEDILTKNFPNIYSYLIKFKELILKIRNSNNEKLNKWLNLDRPREEFIFTSPKIICPQRSYKNTFGFSINDFFASADVYFIVQKNIDYNLKYILALLNSKLYFCWLYNKGKRKGDMLELYQQPLSEIPIKKIPAEDQKPFITLVDQILEITSTPDYNPKNPPVKQKELEKQIDEMVYKLYELTEEEIGIIEDSSKK